LNSGPGLSNKTRQIAFIETLIYSGGLGKALTESVSFLVMFYRAAAAASKAGKALANSASTSALIALAASTST
jgi:hypothetical protein